MAQQRDAGVLAGKRPGEKVGKLTTEQAEIARLTREQDLHHRHLAGARLHSEGGRAEKDQPSWHLAARSTLLESLSERADHDDKHNKR
jgi:predicted transcriptional regulator